MTEQPTPADELRTAAARIRELAAKATSGICPDWVYSAVRHVARNCAGSFECRHPEHQGWDQPEWDRYDDSPYIAAMHPGVGSALAAWLDSAAVDAREIGANPQALALARAINGAAG